MSSRRSLSRESRSYYSRSSSCDNNNRFQSSNYRRRPLSSLLIDREFSPARSSLGFDRLDDPFFFDRPSRSILDEFDRPSRRIFDDFDRRIRSRWNEDEFFRNDPFDFGRNLPMNSQSSGITRNIPVQYSPSSWNQQERNYTKLDQGNNWSSNAFNRGNFQTRENRISNNDWPIRQKTPTLKRTSMTIFVKQPRVQYSDVPNQQQRSASSSGYSSTYRTTY